jgi:hypothetical protein
VHLLFLSDYRETTTDRERMASAMLERSLEVRA